MIPLAGAGRVVSGRGSLLAHETPDPAPLRVLLAEDNIVNRKVMAALLGQIGVELTAVEDGVQALQALDAQRFDVVLMDMRMPVMDGLTATRTIRGRERLAGSAPTPIFMLTGNAMSEHIEASLEAGADLHLAKPVSSSALRAALGQLHRQDGRAAA